jgi:predicted nucleotidyltransferase
MNALLKPAVYKILKLFYNNHNHPLHLREIARKTEMNESSISRHLNHLVKTGLLKTIPEANLRKFYVSSRQIPLVFPLFDEEKMEKLPLLRLNAIKYFLQKLEKKPIIAVIFGSTAKGNFRDDSDLDLLLITNGKINDALAKSFVEAQTAIRTQTFFTSEKEFKKELKTKTDKVLLSALETGFPVFNQKYYYELMCNES